MKIYTSMAAILLVLSAGAQAAPIQFSSGVKTAHKEQIIKDLKVLENFKFKNADPLTLKILEIDELTGKSALKWIEDRIHYIVEQDFSVEKNVYVIKNDVAYPYDYDVPVAEREKAGFAYQAAPSFAMANLTSFIYGVGKWNQTLYGLKIPQGVFKAPLKIPVTSIRTGIAQIGNTLFYRFNDDLDSTVNIIKRIATYFHEARHSDGHGDHLGFPHAECSRGDNTCEDNLNGPYSTSVAIITEMMKSCDQCSESDKKLLDRIIQSWSVQLPHTKDGDPLTFLDPLPEGL